MLSEIAMTNTTMAAMPIAARPLATASIGSYLSRMLVALHLGELSGDSRDCTPASRGRLGARSTSRSRNSLWSM